MDNNELETLNSALSGMVNLTKLYLSFNKLKKISPDDLIGLDKLRYLDISHNQLTSLEVTSMVSLKGSNFLHILPFFIVSFLDIPTEIVGTNC